MGAMEKARLPLDMYLQSVCCSDVLGTGTQKAMFWGSEGQLGIVLNDEFREYWKISFSFIYDIPLGSYPSLHPIQVSQVYNTYQGDVLWIVQPHKITCL